LAAKPAYYEQHNAPGVPSVYTSAFFTLRKRMPLFETPAIAGIVALKR
jgi:hypothetical protein